MDEQEQESGSRITELAADIVSAYVGHNSLQASDLPALISSVHTALSGTGGKITEEPEPLVPAVSIRKSVSSDYLTCLEDGKTFKSLKRHLRTNHDLTPEEYREKWGLAHDYPMVAPNYAEARSKLAVKAGLGQKRTRKKTKKASA
jgi:predicted transcriptional regulator